MNCKPNQMAVVVTTLGNPKLDYALGCIVKTVTVSEYRSPFGAMWTVEHHDILACADACLRPLKDPGDDAVDEVIQRLGKPVATPEGVPA